MLSRPCEKLKVDFYQLVPDSDQIHAGPQSGGNDMFLFAGCFGANHPAGDIEHLYLPAGFCTAYPEMPFGGGGNVHRGDAVPR